MPAPLPGPRCPSRAEAARCLFVEGHPGLHLCVPARGSAVFLTGSGPLPDDEWLWRIPAESGADGATEWGEWTRAMLERLLHEVREAGGAAPRRWFANLERLRGG